jgi:hypothetical protein
VQIGTPEIGTPNQHQQTAHPQVTATPLRIRAGGEREKAKDHPVQLLILDFFWGVLSHLFQLKNHPAYYCFFWRMWQDDRIELNISLVAHDKKYLKQLQLMLMQGRSFSVAVSFMLVSFMSIPEKTMCNV